MGSLRVSFALAATFLALVGACGGSSQSPPPSDGGAADPGLPCLAYPLTAYCCPAPNGPACVGDFASAQKCTTWDPGSKVRVYPTSCHGFTAVSHTVTGYTSISVYSSSTGTLYAIGDDAASNQPGSLAVECGAGPQNFSMPADCAAMWLDETQGVACASGTSTPASICH